MLPGSSLLLRSLIPGDLKALKIFLLISLMKFHSDEPWYGCSHHCEKTSFFKTRSSYSLVLGTFKYYFSVNFFTFFFLFSFI